MKRNGRKSSNIIDATSDKARIREEQKTLQTQKVMKSPRALVNEPIAWNNDKTDVEKLTGVINNPGRNLRRKKPPIANKDPEPQRFSKNKRRKNYENIPDFEFFKHTTKGK